jgi:aryl-alcohol dehydrogenase-like predicted oxidoreductase
MMKQTSSSKALSSKVGDRNTGSGLGYGCMGITAFYGEPMEDGNAMELLKRVYDSGVRHFDTAEIYKTGEMMSEGPDDEYNEVIVGKFLQTVPRDSFTIATKFMPFKHGAKNDYDTVKKSFAASLDRLGLDHVDLYYCHRITSLEGAMEFARAAKRLKEEGLIKGIGLSEIRGSWLKKIHTEVCPIDAVQQEWSLMTRNLEEELVPVCKELGVTVVAYSPLSRNLLASIASTGGDYSAFRSSLPRFQGDAYTNNIQLMKNVMLPLAEKYSCSVAQLSLAWLFHRAHEMGVAVVPIPGSTKIKNVESNAESTNILIDAEDMILLDAFAEKVIGARGGEHYTSIGFEAQQD